MADEPKNEHAAALSKLGASKGGRARASKLTPEQRSQIAREGAEARWSTSDDDLPEATYGAPDRPLRIADMEIPAYVLDDGRRVLVKSGIQAALDMSSGSSSSGAGADRLSRFIDTKGISPFVSKELVERTKNPIKFRIPKGGIAYGYEAIILADLCEAVLAARKADTLNYQADHIAARCEILLRGFSRTGITALVDEVTGYQDVRARDALATILEAFVTEELRKWVSTFPAEFYKEIFRLNSWTYPRLSSKRPSVIGHWTNDLIYNRLAPGVREELHRVTPRNAKGRLKHKLFQHLTDDIGHPRLREHLTAVIALMRASDRWSDFMTKMDRALPRWDSTYLLPMDLPVKKRKA
jgi:hypothetical protein